MAGLRDPSRPHIASSLRAREIMELQMTLAQLHVQVDALRLGVAVDLLFQLLHIDGRLLAPFAHDQPHPFDVHAGHVPHFFFRQAEQGLNFLRVVGAIGLFIAHQQTRQARPDAHFLGILLGGRGEQLVTSAVWPLSIASSDFTRMLSTSVRDGLA